MTTDYTEPKTIKSEHGLSLIEVAPSKFCVQEKVKGIFGTSTTKYFLTRFNGLHFKTDQPCISDFETCQLIYNANLLLKAAK